VMTSRNIESMQVHNASWKNQIFDALTVNGGDVEGATGFDYFMHVLLFGWKVLFSMIPPPGMLGGWLCFFCSLGAIGVLTAIVGVSGQAGRVDFWEAQLITNFPFKYV